MSENKTASKVKPPLEITISEHKEVANADYFWSVIYFFSIFIWSQFDIFLPEGFYYALVGTSIATPLITTIMASRGLLDKKFYNIESQSANIFGDFLLSTIGLIALWSSNKFLGYVDEIIPNNEVLIWFILGFLIVRLVKSSFTFLNKRFQLSLFTTTLLSTIITISIGVVVHTVA